MKITDVLHEHSVVNPGNTLVEAGEWKAEAEDFKEWSNHVKDTLLGVDPSQRFAMAKRLSQIEMKHFGAGQATASGSFNNQTGRPTGNTSGMTTTVEHILDAINAGKLNKSSSPDTTAAVASAGTTQQTPFGSVTRPAGQPDPYHASPATQYGDRPAAQAAQNRPRPQQGGGSIRILRTEQDWEEALSDPDSGRDLDADNPVITAAGFDKEMSKLPSWKVMLATIMLGLKLPIVGDKIKNLLVSSIQKNFGITMSPKEALEYMKHVRNTPGDQIVPPAVWKFERDGGDYETAIEQLPDDAVEVRPAEVMSAIATDLIDAGVAQEIETGNKPKDEPEDETPSNAGAGAFGNMSSQLTKKDKELAESTELATILKYAGIPLTEGVLDDTRARMDARRNPTAAQPATAPVAADDGYKVGDVVEYWTGMKMPQNPQRGTIISIVKNQGGEEITVRTDNGLENRLDTRNKSQIIRKVAPTAEPVAEPVAEPAGQEPVAEPAGQEPVATPSPTASSTPDLPQATMTRVAGVAAIQYNGKSYEPSGPGAASPEGVTGTQVLVPAAAFGIRSMGKVVALLSDDGTAYAEQPIKVFNPIPGLAPRREVTPLSPQPKQPPPPAPLGMAEGKKKSEADYGDDYQDMVARVKKLAGLGPLKTVYDPAKRVYRNVPTAVQPKK